MNIKDYIKKIILQEAYKWKPSAAQRKAFAQKMQDPVERDAYEKRKKEREEKRRSSSKFNYSSAGGNYIPTEEQYRFVMKNMDLFKTPEEENAANMITYGYTTGTKVHHDHIHIVNEKRRENPNL